MSLTDEINEKAKDIHSDGYSMSLGEIANLYKDNELRLHPEFQRVFRWSDGQKSRLIESALLGIPLPPIFVVQCEDGVWDVIDGLQRLSTFFEFMGILKDENERTKPASVLSATKFLPSLKDKKWCNDDGRDTEDTFTATQRIDLKRIKLDVKIVTKDSDSDAKYELFQRLNTGGSFLTAQEVRNCLLLMLDETFYEFIDELAHHPAFQDVLALSDRQIDEKFDMELVCRYFAGKNTAIDDFRSLADINEFVNERMTYFAKDVAFDREEETRKFHKLFDLLAKLDIHPFAKYNSTKDAFIGMFLISTYEVVAIGLGKAIDSYSEDNLAEIKENLQTLWSDRDFIEASGSGKSAKNRMAKCVEIGIRLFPAK